MARLLSDYFGVDEKKFAQLGVFDAYIGIDTHLFVDPHLLKRTKIPEFVNSYKNIQTYFSDIITLLLATQKMGDRAWKEAYRRLIFKELKGVSIGYGVHSSDGNAIGPRLGGKLLETSQEIIQMGIKDPEIFVLIGLFEEDFGADRLSDMTIRIIRNDLFTYTDRIARELQIKDVAGFNVGEKKFYLPIRPDRRGPLIFLPMSLLRDLPVALTWEGIDHVVAVNRELRERLNQMIGNAWKNKIKKSQLRDMILTNKSNIEELVKAYRQSSAESYDFEKDPQGKVSWAKVGLDYAQKNPVQLILEDQSQAGLEAVVRKIIEQFKKNIEVNGLKEHLYEKNGFLKKPRHERFSQLLFYATADSYCDANNLDINREPNAGSGPVDFKLSHGRKARVLVEIKLSTNNLVNGYQKQLKAYEESEGNCRSMYLVIRVTRSDASIKNLLEYKKNQEKQGHSCSEIFLVDARIFPSASHR